ncbi:MAG TPA: hypothetical protein PLJ60_07325 [Chryseolinea sp.]|nr:hypothetical protein [Chryseolinea sp.]HPM30132.1 hypothetical protein [Chryseolinea sp.]
MKDKMEEFIRQNRNAFDDREPSEKVWRNIKASLSFGEKSWFNNVTLWRAAAIIFFALSVYLIIPKGILISKSESISSREFRDVEEFYTQQILNKVKLIHDYTNNEGLNGFTHDFQQLEAMYLVLKEQMNVSPSDKVKDALVLNLLVRIDLLNQQLHSLEKEVPSKEEEQPETSI